MPQQVKYGLIERSGQRCGTGGEQGSLAEAIIDAALLQELRDFYP